MWWSFIADGRLVSTQEESARTNKEIIRLRGLAGISIQPATDSDLIKINAKTLLPKRITDKMSQAAKRFAKQEARS